MAFWSQNIEPKRTNRWKIVFGVGDQINKPADLSTIVYALKNADKPSYKVNNIVHKFANHNFKYPGRVEWNTIALKFASVTDPDAASILYNIMLNAGYKNPTEIFAGAAINYSFLKKGAGGTGGFFNAIGQVNLIQVDADGADIENWKLNSPFFTDVKFGTLDYGNENIIDVECTVRFDWAELVNPELDGQAGGAAGGA